MNDRIYLLIERFHAKLKIQVTLMALKPKHIAVVAIFEKSRPGAEVLEVYV